MFLFDKSRHGRQEKIAFTHIPYIKWKTELKTNPLFGAESTAVIDENGNLFFGSHSGNFYCLNSKGEIKWSYSTSEKIYSSPLLLNNKVIFAGGDGYLYCLDVDGNLIWKFDLTTPSKSMFQKKTINKLLHLPYTYDFNKKKIIEYKSWSSPNFINGKILITGYGKGLYCLNENGEILWSFDLGFPRFQLSGVAINRDNKIFCSSRSGKIFSFNENGVKLWGKTIKSDWENWGNPVVCDIKEQIYFFFAKKEKYGIICATDFFGNEIWTQKFGSIRGSCTISWDGNYIYCCDLNGFLYKIETSSGIVKLKKKITNAQRGLWITPTLDLNSNILLSTKDSNTTGRVILLNDNFESIWEFESNKILSIPVIGNSGEIYFGSWDGCYYCLI